MLLFRKAYLLSHFTAFRNLKQNGRIKRKLDVIRKEEQKSIIEHLRNHFESPEDSINQRGFQAAAFLKQKKFYS